MGKVQVVDTFTGEVHDFHWSNETQLKDVYLQIKNQIAAFERAKEKLSKAFDEFLGDQERHDFGDGYELLRIIRATKKYPKGVVGKYLDEDQLDLVTEVNGPKLKTLMKQLAEENQLEPGAWKDIENNADVKYHKPYVKLQKVAP